MPTTGTARGARFVEALANRDLHAARDLLHAEVTLAALMPDKSIDKTGVEDVFAAFCQFVVDDCVQSLELLDDHDIAGRRAFAYRCHWSTPDHGPHVFEQHGFYDTRDGQISWIHLACSGDQAIALGT
jgi:hypothetical protein